MADSYTERVMEAHAELRAENEALKETLKQAAYSYLKLCQSVSGISHSAAHRELKQLLLRDGKLPEGHNG